MVRIISVFTQSFDADFKIGAEHNLFLNRNKLFMSFTRSLIKMFNSTQLLHFTIVVHAHQVKLTGGHPRTVYKVQIHRSEWFEQIPSLARVDFLP